MKNILVLCTGNVCRSPTAAFLLRRELAGVDCSIRSAGIAAVLNSSAEELAQKVALEHGLDISSHRSCQVTMNMLQWADLVLVIEKMQKMSLLSRYPWLQGKIFRYGEPQQVDVPDPHGHSEHSFRMSWNFIEKMTPYWVEKIAHPEGNNLCR